MKRIVTDSYFAISLPVISVKTGMTAGGVPEISRHPSLETRHSVLLLPGRFGMRFAYSRC